MPLNPSVPYGAGGAPQLPSQSIDGSNLQQSFQQYNQEQRGTAAPKVPWALSKAEKKQYDQIFRAWDTGNTGFINGQTALEVFGQSGLSKEELGRIWCVHPNSYPTPPDQPHVGLSPMLTIVESSISQNSTSRWD